MSVGYLAKCSSRGVPKKSHPTRAAAEAHRASLIAIGRWRASSSSTYFCPPCGGYHAGSTGIANRGGGRKAAKNTPRRLDSQ